MLERNLSVLRRFAGALRASYTRETGVGQGTTGVLLFTAFVFHLYSVCIPGVARGLANAPRRLTRSSVRPAGARPAEALRRTTLSVRSS